MSEQNQDNHEFALQEYLTVAIAEDIDLAEQYKELLEEHDIPAVITTQKSYSSGSIGISVMVPEPYMEAAQELIESRQDFDNFLDGAFNDPDEWDYDKGFGDRNDGQDEDSKNY